MPSNNPIGADNEQGSPSATDLAWLAGHFDGDGWVGLMRQNRKANNRMRYSAAATVVTTSPVIRDRITEVYSLLPLKFHVIVQEPQVRPNGKIWRRKWNISVKGNTSARTLLEAMRPYLTEKGRQADIVLEHLDWRDTLPKNPGFLRDETEERSEATFYRLREDRQRYDPSTTTRLAPSG